MRVLERVSVVSCSGVKSEKRGAGEELSTAQPASRSNFAEWIPDGVPETLGLGLIEKAPESSRKVGERAGTNTPTASGFLGRTYMWLRRVLGIRRHDTDAAGLE